MASRPATPSSAGYFLVTSAKREQGRMIAVVLGAKAEKDRVSSQALLNYGFPLHDAADARGRRGAGRTARLAR